MKISNSICFRFDIQNSVVIGLKAGSSCLKYMEITSIYFCSATNHSACYHDRVRYLTPSMILTHESQTSLQHFSVEKKLLAESLQKKEEFYQIALEFRLGLRHEYLNSQNITDLSDEYNLIEIKIWNQFRQALGQINEYNHLKKSRGGKGHKKVNKFILLFGNSFIPTDTWQRWTYLSQENDVKLLNCGSAIHFVNDYIKGRLLRC